MRLSCLPNSRRGLAGVGAVFVDVSWRDPVDDVAVDLPARLALYKERGLKTVVTAMLVDGLVSHRPQALSELTWDDDNVIAAAEIFIDDIAAAGIDRCASDRPTG